VAMLLTRRHRMAVWCRRSRGGALTYVYFAMRLDITDPGRFAWDEMLVRPVLNTPTAIQLHRRGWPSMTSRRVTDTVVDDVASRPPIIVPPDDRVGPWLSWWVRAITVVS
jgi:hypothetical protein